MSISIMSLQMDKSRGSLAFEISINFINCLGYKLVSIFSVFRFKESIDTLYQLFAFVLVNFDQSISHP